MAATRRARLRVFTHLRMPDCCVLLAAQASGGTIATYDERLRRAAGERQVPVIPAEHVPVVAS